jgi:hypothetical protein
LDEFTTTLNTKKRLRRLFVETGLPKTKNPYSEWSDKYWKPNMSYNAFLDALHEAREYGLEEGRELFGRKEVTNEMV